jgi:hypothetical protein
VTQPQDVPVFVDDDDDETAPPLPFKISFRRNGETEREEEQFTALPSIPYAWIMEFFASGTQNVIAQSAAQLQWFERVITPEDKDRFFKLIHDPAVRVKAATLRDVAMYLVGRYQHADPTRARSAGQNKSRNGSGKTKSGSSGRSRAKASTS